LAAGRLGSLAVNNRERPILNKVTKSTKKKSKSNYRVQGLPDNCIGIFDKRFEGQGSINKSTGF
jgi:hypothetical protein